MAIKQPSRFSADAVPSELKAKSVAKPTLMAKSLSLRWRWQQRFGKEPGQITMSGPTRRMSYVWKMSANAMPI